MQTRIVGLEHLDLALSFLRKGEPIVFPTETVYGLGAPVFHSLAVQAIFTIKGRPMDNPLIVHISSLSQVPDLVETLPDFFFPLAKAFWPGPLTLVVPRHVAVPACVSAGHPTIALRMPQHPIARRLIDQLGEPLAAPSANLSGRPSPTSSADVLEDLDGRVSLILEGGPCSIGIESTVLSLVSTPPILLRPGSIHQKSLEEVLKTQIALPDRQTPHLAPGMKYRHYAPRAKVRLVFQPEDLQGGYSLSHVTQKNLYASLRQADRLGVAEIEILCDATLRSDPALMNRLLRAAESCSPLDAAFPS